MPAYLAIDLGGESGRVVAGQFDGGRLDVTVVHRFANRAVVRPDGVYWDLVGLYRSALSGVDRSLSALAEPVVSVGVDAWGNDFALLDKAGALLADPRHYRDDRTAGMPALIDHLVGGDEIFRRTGVLSQPINAASQLLAMRGDRALAEASRLSLVPDLFLRWLSGVAVTERTIASTTQLLDIRSGQWATDLVARLGLPVAPFDHPVVEPGVVLGELRPAELGPAGPVHGRGGSGGMATAGRPRVVVVAGHDTAAAVAAVPAAGPSFGFICCGTWSLVGLELPVPITTTAARLAGFTNEVGVDGSFRFLRNGIGLWLLQACRQEWGLAVSYADLIEQASGAPAFAALIDPDHPVFLTVGDMPGRIAEFCRRVGQQPPPGRAELVRCVIDSLALSHLRTVDQAERLASVSIDALHLVGGGSVNALLCQVTADVTGRQVIAGPEEASAIGNLLIQAWADGQLSSASDLRAIVAASFPGTMFEPRLDADRRAELSERFAGIADAGMKAFEP